MSNDNSPLKKAQKIMDELDEQFPKVNPIYAEKWFEEHRFITVIDDETGLQKVLVEKI